MSAPGFAREDAIAVAAFIAVVAVGLAVELARSAMADSPRARIRQRLLNNVNEVAPALEAADVTPAEGARRKHFAADTRLAQLIGRLKAQADHMGGPAGLRWIGGAAGVLALIFLYLWQMLDLNLLLGVALAPAPAAIGGVIGFTLMVRRYRNRFLNAFPDALDLIIRAVRAGVPVVHAIMTAGKELPYPVGREFRLMGDALRLGMDQMDVMDTASKRIGVPDFRYFVVCLQLQRETGGPLADTLENLSNIIRARRELRLKTRALTAQGRAASKIIAMVPLVVMGALKLVGPDYVNVLFETPVGQRILAIAGTMVFVGLIIIARMSKLED